MDIYLDLTLLMNALIYSFIFLYVNKISEIRFSLIRKIVVIFLLLAKYYFLPLIDVSITFIFYLYDIVIYLLMFNKRKIYVSVMFSLFYYLFSTFFMFVEPHILFYKKLLVISSPSATLKLVFMPIPLLIGYYVLIILKNKYVNYKYSYKAQLKYNEQIIALKGYLDSGNTLKVNGIPVIFIKENVGIKLVKKDIINIEYITVNGLINKQEGYLGKIAFRVKDKVMIKKVVFSIVNGNHSFHNCDCLLNAYLF